MQQHLLGAAISPGVFPFKLEDLKSWIIKRKDGTVTRVLLTTAAVVNKGNNTDTKTEVIETKTTGTTGRVVHGFGTFCNHKPDSDPIVEFTREDSSVLRLYIGSMSGARAAKDTFDFIVDCGDIFNTWQLKGDKVLSGDEELATALQPYISTPTETRILKVDWDDRAAAPVLPEFWPELDKLIYGDVMTCCVGGHGRSGTSFVCLLLTNAKDYDALDAIVHLRAVHCPRAIESVAQHEYINEVATFLGRTANAKAAEGITDYKQTFMQSTKPTAVATRKALGWEK